MTDAWPQYQVADQSAVFALGVVSINYARFERTQVWMLAAVANMAESQAAVITARCNPTERANIIETFFKQRQWPDDATTAIKHYISAMRILTESRNILIHGNVVSDFHNRQGVYSLAKSGAATMFVTSTDAIRERRSRYEPVDIFDIANALNVQWCTGGS